MSDSKSTYKRLPGSWIRGQQGRLWQGEDHLLLVRSDGYRENYKRFNYRDIQAIAACHTILGRVATAVFSFVGLFAFVLAMSAEGSGSGPFFFFVFAVSLSLLAFNIFLGPTCKCQVRTAVQVEAIPSLGRLRYVRRMLERIGPRIEAAQGVLSPEDVSSRMREIATGPGQQSAPASSGSPDPGGATQGAPPVIVEAPEPPAVADS